MDITCNRAGDGPVREPLSQEALDFCPGLLAIQESPPARLPRAVAWCTCVLFLILLAWSILGTLDIVASADGKLVPQTYVKIVQPADAGILQEILVRDGERVKAGQVLIRMDTRLARADEASIRSELTLKSLQLRRIDAELRDMPFERKAGDPGHIFDQVHAQYRERRQLLRDSLAQQQETLNRAMHEYASAKEVLSKLQDVTPILKQQADAYSDLGAKGFAGQIIVRDKQREYIEKEKDLRAQHASVAGLEAAVAHARKAADQITSQYRTSLQNERVEAEGMYAKLTQELAKQTHRSGLLELRAPQAGTVADLATHTTGAVVAPGTVLLSIVPEHEPLVAEVRLSNDDVGFVYPGQTVKVKVAAYPFERYGMLDGTVAHIGPDASEPSAQVEPGDAQEDVASYKAIVHLQEQRLIAHGNPLKLISGMRITAEVNQGERTVLEYLLSPVAKTLAQSGHER